MAMQPSSSRRTAATRSVVWLASGLLCAACGAEGPARRDAASSPRDGAGARGDAGGRADSRTDRGLADGAAAAPRVAFIAPQDGASAPNPVLFRISAAGVDEVELFADGSYSLGGAWDPRERDTLRYRFANTGVPRSLRLVGRVGGAEVVEATITVTVLREPCEELFFVRKFDANNQDSSGALDLVAIREEALAQIIAAVNELKACGAKVTLGGMLALLLYEGGLRVGAFNTRCEENSYNKTASDCDAVPEALYSYQFGIAPIHTSNFHPCKGGAYTQTMRQRFLKAAAAAGFSTDAALVSGAIAQRFKQICPSATPLAVDYYILAAHDPFGIPKDSSGNHLAAFGAFPFFTPAVSVAVTFAELAAGCASIDSDREAITVYGGGDSNYATAARQDAILGLYTAFAAQQCN